MKRWKLLKRQKKQTVNKRPIDIAKEDCYDETSPRSFEEDFSFYLLHGYVYSGDDMFVMARPVSSRDIGFALDYKFTFKPETWDTWFVYLGCGDAVTRFFNIAPIPLPFVSWHRGDNPKPKIWPWGKFYKRALNMEMNKNGQHEN